MSNHCNQSVDKAAGNPFIPHWQEDFIPGYKPDKDAMLVQSYYNSFKITLTMTASTPSRPPYKNWPNDGVFQAGEETRSPVELEVFGKFPSQVAGTLYRTGPGQYKVDTENGEYARSHWFDGFTQLHRFQLIPDDSGGCRVHYNSRRQVDELLEQARKSKDIDGIVTFGQKRDPCMSLFGKVKSRFQPYAPDRSHPQLWVVGVTVAAEMPGMPKGTLSSSTDANMIQQAHPETLEPVGVTDQKVLHPELKGVLSCAHPRYDPITGDMFNYNLDFGRWGTYRVFKTSASTSETEILATITGPGTNAAYLHSFFLSEDFVILCVWPSYFRGFGASVLWERNIISSLKFHPDAKAKWYVVDRKGGRGHIATLHSPAFFSFHTVNAFQEDTGETDTVNVYCDLIQYPDDSVLQKLYYENIVSTGTSPTIGDMGNPSFVRYKLCSIPKQGKDSRKDSDMPSAEAIATVPAAGDLPTINPRYTTKKQRYVYGVVSRGYASFFDGLGKTDLETGKVVYWGKEPKPHTPGEAIFIPDGTEETEDAGYLLSVVLDGETGTSYLLCLNARDMTEVARAECPHAIGFGFHGAHYGG